MVLNQISACKGNPGDMIENTLNLGIAILRGGNLDAQTVSWFILKLRMQIQILPINPNDWVLILINSLLSVIVNWKRILAFVYRILWNIYLKIPLEGFWYFVVSAIVQIFNFQLNFAANVEHFERQAWCPIDGCWLDDKICLFQY